MIVPSMREIYKFPITHVAFPCICAIQFFRFFNKALHNLSCHLLSNEIH